LRSYTTSYELSWSEWGQCCSGARCIDRDDNEKFKAQSCSEQSVGRRQAEECTMIYESAYGEGTQPKAHNLKIVTTFTRVKCKGKGDQ